MYARTAAMVLLAAQHSLLTTEACTLNGERWLLNRDSWTVTVVVALRITLHSRVLRGLGVRVYVGF